MCVCVCVCVWCVCVCVCVLPPVSGSSTRYITCWYFNCILRKCHSFIYSGYDSNSNNFVSLEKCVQSCSELKKSLTISYSTCHS